MNKTIAIFLILTCTCFSNALSQHIKLDKKVLSFLTSEEKISITFSFENVMFHEDQITEEEFLKIQYEKVLERKDEEIAKGWLERYNISKKIDWPQVFITSLNEKLSEYNHSPTFTLNDASTKYTMQVHTIWMYFGYNVVVGKKPAKVTMMISFYETDNPEKIITTTKISRAMGLNNKSYDLSNWPSFRRVGKAYKKGAYKLAQALKRVVN